MKFYCVFEIWDFGKRSNYNHTIKANSLRGAKIKATNWANDIDWMFVGAKWDSSYSNGDFKDIKDMWFNGKRMRLMMRKVASY